MQVIIVGAGRVGTVMGYLLHKNSFEILGVHNKHLGSARRAVKQIGAGNAYDNFDLEKNIKFADLVVITTPDDIIARKAEYLSHCDLKDTVTFMHMSGLHPSHILNKNGKKEINVFSLHPLQAVSGFDEGLKLLPEAIFSLEGDKKGLEIGRMIADKLKFNYHLINSDSKVLYHTAAVIASNYLVTLVNTSYEILNKAGINESEIRKGILDLIKGTLSNLENSAPQEVLTGPIARNDINTVKKHREKLKEQAAEQLKLYDIMGKYTAKMAGKEKLQALFQGEFNLENNEEE